MSSGRLRVVFAGTPDFAVPSLAALLAHDARVLAVYTQPDRPAGRGRKLSASPVKRLAEDHGLRVEQPHSLRDPPAAPRLAQLRADVMVVVAYGLILPPAVLATPAHGCINVHASLLSRWRGAAPIQRALLAGDRETGVSVMHMDSGVDTGDVLATRACPIAADDTSASLHDKLAALGAELLTACLEDWVAGRIEPRPQPAEGACLAEKVARAEAAIDWARPASSIERAVRAFNPWPVAYTDLNGSLLRVWEASVVAGRGSPGQVLAAGTAGIEVACGEQALRITRLQLAGKRVLGAEEFCRGVDLSGVRLGQAGDGG